MRFDYLFYQNHRHLLFPKTGWKKETQFTCKNGHLKHQEMSFYLRIWNVRIMQWKKYNRREGKVPVQDKYRGFIAFGWMEACLLCSVFN